MALSDDHLDALIRGALHAPVSRRRRQAAWERLQRAAALPSADESRARFARGWLWRCLAIILFEESPYVSVRRGLPTAACRSRSGAPPVWGLDIVQAMRLTNGWMA